MIDDLHHKIIKVVLVYASFTLAWIIFKDNLNPVFVELFGWNGVKSDLVVHLSLIGMGALVLFTAVRRQLHLHISSETQYKHLFDAHPAPMWIYEQQTFRKIAVNNSAIVLFGYTRAEFERMHILDIVVPEEHSRVMAMTKEFSGDYNPRGNIKLIKKSGDQITGKITSHKIRFQKRGCVMVMCEDVTLQLLQEQKLELLHLAEEAYKEELECKIKQLKETLEEKQRMVEVIDRIHNMVMITDTCGIINWVNEAFITTTGYGREEAMGKTMDFLRGPQTDPEMHAKIRESMRNNDFSTFEIVNYSKAGKGYWVEMTVSAVYNAQNEALRYIYVQNIVTSRKLRDVQITEQNTVLKKLAWTNSHLVRKPIASVLGLVELGKSTENTIELKEIHALIGVCAMELDSITKEVATEIYKRNFDGFTTV